jgi:hypothetical protein
MVTIMSALLKIVPSMYPFSGEPKLLFAAMGCASCAPCERLVWPKALTPTLLPRSARQRSAYCFGVVEGWAGGVAPLSGIELELELAGGVAVDWSALAGGVDASDELGGVLDCIEFSVLGGAAVSEPVACSFEQPAARVSALRHRINKPRFMGGSSLS